jgi:predicted membrane channel-forming protein YqfA (hemolysin III family)
VGTTERRQTAAAGSEGGAPEAGSGEDHKERVNRELIELLNELRVALPGVQVLFAFLLTVPLSSRFDSLTDAQRAVYVATFLATTAATALLMAPTAYHRIRFREGDKERMLRTANVFAIVGIAFLATAIFGAVLFTGDLVFGLPFAAVVAALVLGLLVWAWFALPLWRRARDAADA